MCSPSSRIGNYSKLRKLQAAWSPLGRVRPVRFTSNLLVVTFNYNVLEALATIYSLYHSCRHRCLSLTLSSSSSFPRFCFLCYLHAMDFSLCIITVLLDISFAARFFPEEVAINQLDYAGEWQVEPGSGRLRGLGGRIQITT